MLISGSALIPQLCGTRTTPSGGRHLGPRAALWQGAVPGLSTGSVHVYLLAGVCTYWCVYLLAGVCTYSLVCVRTRWHVQACSKQLCCLWVVHRYLLV